MNFKKQPFGFMDMLRFKKLVPNRRKMLAEGPDTPLPQEYRTNTLAKKLHPGYMRVELTAARPLTGTIRELTFRRVDGEAFPFFRAGQYASIQVKIGDSLVSRPYSIVSSPRQALAGELVLAVENAGFVSGYLNEKAQVGDRFVMTEPSGEFHYETLRDSRSIVGIAGGSGITPFMSMASSLADGDEDYQMTLFYGARTADQLTARCKGLKVVYVLSDEECPGCEKGFVTAKLMEQYADVAASTFFLCGPQAMCDFVEKELAPYGLPKKAVHRDAGCCGFCHSKWLAGEYHVAEGRDGRREADRKFGFIHSCVTFPLSDMEIDVPVAY